MKTKSHSGHDFAADTHELSSVHYGHRIRIVTTQAYLYRDVVNNDFLPVQGTHVINRPPCKASGKVHDAEDQQGIPIDEEEHCGRG